MSLLQELRDRFKQLSEDEKAGAIVELFGETRTGAAVRSFLEGLDTNDKDRLAFIGKEFYEEHVNTFPGPDRFVKANFRQSWYDAVTSFINKTCSRS